MTLARLRTSNDDEPYVDEIRVPSLRIELGIDEDDHADNRLDVVGDAGAGDDPPPDNAEHTHEECCKPSMLFRSYDVGEVVLAWPELDPSVPNGQISQVGQRG